MAADTTNTKLNFISLDQIFPPHGEVFAGPGAQREDVPLLSRSLSGKEKSLLQRARDYATEQNVKTEMVKQTECQQQQKLNILKRTQALVLLSRIYVGSIHYDIGEDMIRQTFAQFGPIKAITMSTDALTQRHKGFCFIEYEYPEAAKITMDSAPNITVCGRPLKVGRPSNMPQLQPVIDELCADTVSVPRIFVTGVHPDLTENDLRQVFQAFGKIRSCRLDPDPIRSGKHRSFGFIEYSSDQEVDDAVSAMNMFDLGGMHLRVTKAITPIDLASRALGIPPANLGPAAFNATAQTLPAAAARAAASVSAELKSLDALQSLGKTRKRSADRVEQSAVTPQVYQAPKQKEAEKRVKKEESPDENITTDVGTNSIDDRYDPETIAETPVTIGSRILVLRNAVGAEDIDESLEGEIQSECERFGPVECVKVYQQVNEKQKGEKDGDEDESMSIDVKIFVAFFETKAAQEAQNALHQRFFGGRIVQAEIYNQSMFFNGDLSH